MCPDGVCRICCGLPEYVNEVQCTDEATNYMDTCDYS